MKSGSSCWWSCSLCIGVAFSCRRTQAYYTGLRRREIGWCWLGAEDFYEEQAGTYDDAGVGDVEVRPVVADDVDFEKVDDEVVVEAIVEIAEGSRG